MKRPKIVVPDDFPPVLSGSAAEGALRALGDVEIHTTRGADQEPELARRIGAAEAVLNIRAHARFTEAVINSCPNLRLISIWGTGTDHVDLAACRTRNITVVGTPGVNANAVAEHTIALVLAGLRRIPALDAAMKRGEWARSPIAQFEGRTLGIIGLGAIGRRVAALAAPFGVRLLATSATPDAGRAIAVGATAVPIEALLAESDVVSLHLRLDAETNGFLSPARIARMKPGALLVNTARGALVDRAALIDALQDGRLGGAALDVFHDEPLAESDPLRSLPNVLLTPHIAGNTPEVIAAGLALAVQNIASVLRDMRD